MVQLRRLERVTARGSRRLAWIVLAVALLGGCDGDVELPEEDPVRSSVHLAFRELGVYGYAYAVIGAEERPVEGVGRGMRGREDRRAVDLDTVFAAGDVGQGVLALLALQLAAEGKLDLDGPLNGYLDPPPVIGATEEFTPTARQVLSQSSGLPAVGKPPYTLRFEPGDGFTPSPIALDYLVRVLERVSGQDLEALAQSRVFAPLAMTRSGFVWNDRFEDNHAVGLDALDRAAPIPRDRPPGASTLLTSVDDLVKLVQALLDQGAPLGIEVAPMFEPLVEATPPGDPAQNNVFWGLGWAVERRGESEAIFHAARGGGFSTMIFALPAQGKAVIALTNGHQGLSEMWRVCQFVQPRGRRPLARWLAVPRFDAPELVVQRGLRAVYSEFDASAGREMLDDFYRRMPGTMSEAVHEDLDRFLEAHGRVDERLDAAEYRVGRYPDSARAYQRLAQALTEAGRTADAAEAFERAAALDPAVEGAAR